MGWGVMYGFAWFFFKIFMALKKDKNKPFTGWIKVFLEKILSFVAWFNMSCVGITFYPK